MTSEPTRCNRCHEPVIMQFAKLTSESEPYCSHCGYVFGTSVAPASWVCEDCSEVVLDHGGEDRPWCETCKVPMSCVRATASLVHGAGTGEELDIGLALLLQAQVVVGDPKENYWVLAQLGLAKSAETRRKEQKLGEDILRDSLDLIEGDCLYRPDKQLIDGGKRGMFEKFLDLWVEYWIVDLLIVLSIGVPITLLLQWLILPTGN